VSPAKKSKAKAVKFARERETIDKPNVRQKILQALEDILIEQGPGEASVDNIIARAGVSKGGFFYHFKTKQDLLIASFLEFVKIYEELVKAAATNDSNPIGRSTRAMITVMVGPSPLAQQAQFQAMAKGLVVMLNENPELSKAIQQTFDELNEVMTQEGLSRDLVMLIGAALDGIWLSETLGVCKLEAAERERMYSYLMKLTERTDL
jgi:AcrR family transcriptional regulator